MSHDFEAQKADTWAVFHDIAEGADLPAFVNVDYQFVPDDGADWDAAMAALEDAGYDVNRFEAAPEDGPLAKPWLEATLADQPVSALAIWTGEEQATRIALAHGFLPDGWGFWAEED